MAIVVLAAVSAWSAPPAAAQEKYGTDAPSLQAAARELAVALRDAPKLDAKLRKWQETFCKWLAVQGPPALEAVQSLLKDPSPDIQAFGAEMLVQCARGDTYADYDKERPAARKVVPTEALGPVAGALMGSTDPFLSAMGEWALSVRLGKDYEPVMERVTGVAKPWPGADGPEWYRQWIAQAPEKLLERDCVRQAVAAGAHRSTKALARSADDMLRRAEGLTGYIRAHGGPQQVAAEAGLQRAQAAAAQLRQAAQKDPQDVIGQRKLWLAARVAVRDVTMANPDINFQQIVFALRRGDGGGGNITFGRANSAPPGGDIVIKAGLSPADPVKPLIAGRLGPGHVKGLELWFDADRLVFAYARQPADRDAWEQAHLFEMNIDGTNLRQLTAGKFQTDQEPTYLPNGDIVFCSDRSFFGSQCAGALEQDNMILNLYRCDSDGNNLRPLSNNKDFDRFPHMMDNGQLLFLHWEYLDRHLWHPHTLWTCHPDGTMNDAVYKQHICEGPMSLRETRQIPGRQKLVGVACGHHNSDMGAVMLVDYDAGINEPDAMRMVTPGVSGTEGGYGKAAPVAEGGVQDAGGYYRFPCPLSEKSFLVSYSYNLGGPNFCLYYIDVWGNKELIHRDVQTSVAFLSPLRKTPKPPILPDLAAPEQDGKQRFAKAYLHNVNNDLPGVPPGTVKHIRIAQPMPWPCVKNEEKGRGFTDLHYMSTTGWAPAFGMWGWGASRAIGIVPVEEDGSAYFKVPVDQPVFFQALDKDYTEVRRMRSYVTFMRGETRGCIGCHESKEIAPPTTRGMGLASRRDASMPTPPPVFGDRLLPDYETHIQPILDRHCVSCHGQKDPNGGLDFTSRKVHNYNQSYRTLFGLKPSDPTPSMSNGYWRFWYPDQAPPCDDATSKAMLKEMHNNKYPGQLVTIASRDLGAEVTPPMAYGSSISKFTRAVLEHQQKKGWLKELTQDEWIALVTWVDLNAQYWGTYVDKDSYFAKTSKTCRRVKVVFPDPWESPAAGEWYWASESEVRVRPAKPEPAPAAAALSAKTDAPTAGEP